MVYLRGHAPPEAFFSLLISHQELSLEDGFQIRVVLLSVDHVQQQLGKVKAAAKRNAVYLKDYYDKPFGARTGKHGQTVVPKRKYYRIEAGTMASPHCFANSCLLIALTVGDLFHKAFEKHEKGNPTILQHLKALQSKKSKAKQEEAAFFVTQHAYQLMKGIKGLQLVGPHTLRQLEPLCRKHKIQLCIYSKAFGNKLVAQLPKGPYLAYKKIHLYENTLLEEDVLTHVDLLLEPPATMDGRFYTACCTALVHRKDVKCPHMLKCLECRRPMVKQHHYYSHLMTHVCTRLRNDIKAHKLPTPKVCSGCMKRFKNSQCFVVHTQNHCGLSKQCRCKTVLTVPTGKRDLAKPEDRATLQKKLDRKLAQHQCSKTLCRLCYHWTDDIAHHSCPLKIPK